MKTIRIIWYITFLIASIWCVWNLLFGNIEWWVGLLPIAFLISTMPFFKPSDFNVFRKPNNKDSK
jgi:hypothetical protein